MVNSIADLIGHGFNTQNTAIQWLSRYIIPAHIQQIADSFGIVLYIRDYLEKSFEESVVVISGGRKGL